MVYCVESCWPLTRNMLNFFYSLGEVNIFHLSRSHHVGHMDSHSLEHQQLPGGVLLRRGWWRERHWQPQPGIGALHDHVQLLDVLRRPESGVVASHVATLDHHGHHDGLPGHVPAGAQGNGGPQTDGGFATLHRRLQPAGGRAQSLHRP